MPGAAHIKDQLPGEHCSKRFPDREPHTATTAAGRADLIPDARRGPENPAPVSVSELTSSQVRQHLVENDEFRVT